MGAIRHLPKVVQRPENGIDVREVGDVVAEVLHAGLGSILATVSKDTDTAHSCILSVSKIHFQPTFLNGICI